MTMEWSIIALAATYRKQWWLGLTDMANARQGSKRYKSGTLARAQAMQAMAAVMDIALTVNPHLTGQWPSSAPAWMPGDWGY